MVGAKTATLKSTSFTETNEFQSVENAGANLQKRTSNGDFFVNYVSSIVNYQRKLKMNRLTNRFGIKLSCLFAKIA